VRPGERRYAVAVAVATKTLRKPATQTTRTLGGLEQADPACLCDSDDAVASLASSVPLTRSGEARKGRVLEESVVLDRDDLRRTLLRIAHEIVEKNPGGKLGLVGIHTRGAVLATRLHALVGELSGSEVPLGDLDISFYRDDLDSREPARQPVVHASHLDFDLAGRTLVLVDDVLFTGRTVRAAIDALFDYGRPDRIQLAVLVDRGHRELPIRPDYVGKNLPTSRDQRVNVRLEETDGVDEVSIGADRSGAAIGAEADAIGAGGEEISTGAESTEAGGEEST